MGEREREMQQAEIKEGFGLSAVLSRLPIYLLNSGPRVSRGLWQICSAKRVTMAFHCVSLIAAPAASPFGIYIYTYIERNSIIHDMMRNVLTHLVYLTYLPAVITTPVVQPPLCR